MKPLIAPSLLSANFANLQADIDMINRSKADWLHLDIMDGVFVPNISFGFPVIEAIAPLTRKPLDVHLMITQPEKFISRLQDLGVYMVNVHYEACLHLHRTLQEIKKAGMKARYHTQPAYAGSTARRHHYRCRHDTAHVGKSGIRRPAVHTPNNREDSPSQRDDSP